MEDLDYRLTSTKLLTRGGKEAVLSRCPSLPNLVGLEQRTVALLRRVVAGHDCWRSAEGNWGDRNERVVLVMVGCEKWGAIEANNY